MRNFKSVFGGSKPKRPPTPLDPSPSSAHPSSVQPPLIEGPFSRPGSYTFAPTVERGTEDVSSKQAPAVHIYPPSDSNIPRRPPNLQSIPETSADLVSSSEQHGPNLVSASSPPVADQPIDLPGPGPSSESLPAVASSSESLRPPVKRNLTIKSADMTGWQEQFKLAQTAGSSGAILSDQEKDASSDKVFIAVHPVSPAPASQPPLGLKVLASRPESGPVSLHAPAWNAHNGVLPGRRSELQDTKNTGVTTTNAVATLPASNTVKTHVNKPTCSLNLLCYRPGYQGCVLKQITVIGRSRYPNEDAYRKALNEHKNRLICRDDEFFRTLQSTYSLQMCSFWRRHLSMKTLQQIRLLSYTGATRPEVVPLDDFTLQEVFYAYNNPSMIESETAWIDWVFNLRQADRRHALEFVEGWSGTRIATVGSIPWISASVVGIVWVARGGDAQTAFTVASFILTVGTSLLALLAIVSKIES